jgi:hypothetical protein
LEYELPDTDKPPPPPRYNAPPVDEHTPVAPGLWVMLLASLAMIVVFGLGVVCSFLPWWQGSAQEAENFLETEANLWDIKTTTLMQSEESEHLGCKSSCDQTRVINNKMRIRQQTWDDVCRNTQSEDIQSTCGKLTFMRVCIACGLLTSFLHLVPACMSFTASGNRSVVRFEPWKGIVLGMCAAISLAGAIISAFLVEGKVPFAGDEEGVTADRNQSLKGSGFDMCVLAFVFTAPGVLLSALAQIVASTFEVAPFEWDHDIRPPVYSWSAAFAEAPASKRIAWADENQDVEASKNIQEDLSIYQVKDIYLSRKTYVVESA